jgi:hypothetical protein
MFSWMRCRLSTSRSLLSTTITLSQHASSPPPYLQLHAASRQYEYGISDVILRWLFSNFDLITLVNVSSHLFYFDPRCETLTRSGEYLHPPRHRPGPERPFHCLLVANIPHVLEGNIPVQQYLSAASKRLTRQSKFSLPPASRDVDLLVSMSRRSVARLSW